MRKGSGVEWSGVELGGRKEEEGDGSVNECVDIAV